MLGFIIQSNYALNFDFISSYADTKMETIDYNGQEDWSSDAILRGRR
jgi:hypothetical protein